jgi:hypothetical protein
MQRETWHAMLEAKGETIWLWVSNSLGQDVLRAALPRAAAHPRALLSILEGLALYSGRRLYAVGGADCRFGNWGDICGDDPWLEDTALVVFFSREVMRPPYRVDVCANCRGQQPEDEEDGHWE